MIDNTVDGPYYVIQSGPGSCSWCLVGPQAVLSGYPTREAANAVRDRVNARISLNHTTALGQNNKGE